MAALTFAVIAASSVAFATLSPVLLAVLLAVLVVSVAAVLLPVIIWAQARLVPLLQGVPHRRAAVAEGGEGLGELAGGGAHDLGPVLEVERVAEAR